MTLTMYDSINVADLPGGADAYAGYVDGKWPTITELRARFPHRHTLSIAVFAADDAQCLDIETGDASPAQFPAWAKRQHEQRNITRPCAYASVSLMDEIVATVLAAGLQRTDVRLWSAHYGAGKHICGPATCGQVSVPMDGTQWRNDAPGTGGSLIDESILAAGFFPALAVPPPPPAAPVTLFGYLVTESGVGNVNALTGRAVTSTDGGKTWA